MSCFNCSYLIYKDKNGEYLEYKEVASIVIQNEKKIYIYSLGFENNFQMSKLTLLLLAKYRALTIFIFYFRHRHCLFIMMQSSLRKIGKVFGC